MVTTLQGKIPYFKSRNYFEYNFCKNVNLNITIHQRMTQVLIEFQGSFVKKGVKSFLYVIREYDEQ